MVETVIKTIPSKGTRLKMAGYIGMVVSIAWVLTSLAVLFDWSTMEKLQYVGVGYERWESTMIWLLGIYAASETGVKAGEAVMNRSRE